MGLVKQTVNTVKNIGRNVPKGKYKKHTPRPARDSVRRSKKDGGKLR